MGKRFTAAALAELRNVPLLTELDSEHLRGFVKMQWMLSPMLARLITQLNPYAEENEVVGSDTHMLLCATAIGLSQRFPEYCTIPHSIALGIVDSQALHTLLQGGGWTAQFVADVPRSSLQVRSELLEMRNGLEEVNPGVMSEDGPVLMAAKKLLLPYQAIGRSFNHGE